MGFRNDIKAGVKKLCWGSLKKKLTRSDKHVDVTPAETAEAAEEVSPSTPAIFVLNSSYTSPTPPSIPKRVREIPLLTTSPPTTSRVPAGLSWETRTPTPVTPVLTTNDALHESHAPRSTSTQSLAIIAKNLPVPVPAPSVTQIEPQETEDRYPPFYGHNVQDLKINPEQYQPQLTTAINGLSEKSSASLKDNENFFEPALPSELAGARSKRLPRPLEHQVWFKDARITNTTVSLQTPRQSSRPTITALPQAEGTGLNKYPNLFVNHTLIEQVTKRAATATSIPHTLRPSLSSLALSSRTSQVAGLQPRRLDTSALAQYTYGQQGTANQSPSPLHSTAQIQASQSCRSSYLANGLNETASADLCPAVPCVNRPRTALKQLVHSRATIVRENEQLVEELNLLGQQNEAGTQLVETLFALNNGLTAQLSVSQRDIAVLTYQLQQAQIQHAGTLATIQQAIDVLGVERATNANLQSTADELHRRRNLLQEQVQQQAVEAFDLQTQVVDLTDQRNTLQQKKDFAEEDGARWQRHCEEAEEERDAFEQEKESAETDAAQWKERCGEAEEHAEECMLKLNRLRDQQASSNQGRKSEPATNHFAPPESDSGSDEELPTREELHAERAHDDARFQSYQNHVAELEDELTAANEHIRFLGGRRHGDDSTSGQHEHDDDDDLHASNPQTLQDARQCIAHLRERAEEVERQRVPLAAWIEDLDKALTEFKAKHETSLKHIELLQNYEARKDGCQHAQQAISLLHQKQELEEQTTAAYKKLESEHAELTAYQDRTLCDLIYTDSEKTNLSKQNKDLKADNARLFNDNRTLSAFLNNRVFGTDGEPTRQKLRHQRDQIRDLEQGVDVRNARIRDLVAESRYFLNRNEKFGKGGVVQTLEERVATANINRLKYEAIVKAMEIRFERDLRREKLEVGLGPAETEFTDQQEVQKKELRRINADFYTLKNAETTKDELEWWMV